MKENTWHLISVATYGYYVEEANVVQPESPDSRHLIFLCLVYRPTVLSSCTGARIQIRDFVNTWARANSDEKIDRVFFHSWWGNPLSRHAFLEIILQYGITKECFRHIPYDPDFSSLWENIIVLDIFPEPGPVRRHKKR